MESTNQSSGFEHLVTIATSSKDLAMNDQDTNIDGIGELREEPAHDELATTLITRESGEMTVPENGVYSDMAISMGGLAAATDYSTNRADSEPQEMQEDENQNDTGATEAFPDSADEASDAAPDAFDEAVDAYDFSPRAPSYRYSIEELMYYRDSPNNTPLEQLRFCPEAPLDIVLRSNTSSFEAIEYASDVEGHGSTASMSEDEEVGPQTGGVMINAGVYPERQPISPPEGTEAQRVQGFVKFLKKSIAPADRGYVTCGGRVIPAAEFGDVADLVQGNHVRENNYPVQAEEMAGSWESLGSQYPRPADWPTRQSSSSTNPIKLEVSPMISGAQLASAEAQGPTEAFPEYVDLQSTNNDALYMGSADQHNDGTVQPLVPRVYGDFRQMQGGAQNIALEVIPYPPGTTILSSMPHGFNLIQVSETSFRSLWENSTLILELWPLDQPTNIQLLAFSNLEMYLQRQRHDLLRLGTSHSIGLSNDGPRERFLNPLPRWPGLPIRYAYQPPVGPIFPAAVQLNPSVALANVQTSNIDPSVSNTGMSLANMQADCEMLEEALDKLNKAWALNGDDNNPTAMAEFKDRRGHLVNRKAKLRRAIKEARGSLNARPRHMPNNNSTPLLLSTQDEQARRNAERPGLPAYTPQRKETVVKRRPVAIDTSNDYELAVAIQQKYYVEDLARAKKSRRHLSPNAPSFVPRFIESASRSSAQPTQGSGSTQWSGRHDRQISDIDGDQSHAGHGKGPSKRPRHKRCNTDDTWNSEIEASMSENEVIKNIVNEHARNRALLESSYARSSSSPYAVASPSSYAVASPSPYAVASPSLYAGPSSPPYPGPIRQSLMGPNSIRRPARFDESQISQQGTNTNENDEEKPTPSFDRSLMRPGDLRYANHSFDWMSSANAETLDVHAPDKGKGAGDADVKRKGNTRANDTFSRADKEAYAFRHWHFPGAQSHKTGRTQTRSDREQKENDPCGENGSSKSDIRTGHHKASASVESTSFTAAGFLPRSRENTIAPSYLSFSGNRQTQSVFRSGHENQYGNATNPQKPPTLRLRPTTLPQNPPTLHLRPNILPQGPSTTEGTGLTCGPPVAGPTHKGYSPQDVRSSDRRNRFFSTQRPQHDRRGNWYDEHEDERRVHEHRMRDAQTSGSSWRSGQSNFQAETVSQQSPTASRRRHRRERSPLMLEENSQDGQPPRLVPFLPIPLATVAPAMGPFPPVPPRGPEYCTGRPVSLAQHGNPTTLSGNDSTTMTSSQAAPGPVWQNDFSGLAQPQNTPQAPRPRRNLLSFGTYRHAPSANHGGNSGTSQPSSQASVAYGPHTNLGHNPSALQTSHGPAASVAQNASVSVNRQSQNENSTGHLGHNSSALVTSLALSAPVFQSSSIGMGFPQNGRSSTLVGHNSSAPLPNPGVGPPRGLNLTNLLESNAIGQGTDWNPSGFPTQPRPSGHRNRPRVNGGNPFAPPPPSAEEEKEALFRHLDLGGFM